MAGTPDDVICPEVTTAMVVVVVVVVVVCMEVHELVVGVVMDVTAVDEQQNQFVAVRIEQASQITMG
jgi:hypothetical protein